MNNSNAIATAKVESLTVTPTITAIYGPKQGRNKAGKEYSQDHVTIQIQSLDPQRQGGSLTNLLLGGSGTKLTCFRTVSKEVIKKAGGVEKICGRTFEDAFGIATKLVVTEVNEDTYNSLPDTSPDSEKPWLGALGYQQKVLPVGNANYPDGAQFLDEDANSIFRRIDILPADSYYAGNRIQHAEIMAFSPATSDAGDVVNG